ncbi:hypothetical protein Pst134EA_027819 [Puccinia striiformis f. sp. tritici]|uniref:hypothetical protein n=1 Tax=Puccinia striiformis f. sp. tritici TaxID=168172 RepID=UPI0020087200|nr:hypothetical protein Pst134EA_027819 [Puccinia striiformis f. sp. tritici]KAH9448508.1 hypothetical protein Pst134EA_027819 [Puccinia striiformis f. sp. tritici]
MKDFAAINKVFDPHCKLECLKFTLGDQVPDPNDPSATSLVKVKANLAAWFKEVVASKQRAASNITTGKSADPDQSWQAPVEDDKDIRYKKYTHVVSSTAELDLYLQEPPVLSNTPEFSVLSWWSAHKGRFPTLA